MSEWRTDGPRACGKAELPEVIQLVDGIMRVGSDQSMYTDYPLVYRDANLGNIRIIKADNRLASVVPFIPRAAEVEGSRFSIGIISPTATAESFRRKGLASLCLADCLRLMNERDIELSVLWTKVETFPFYEAAGYAGVRHQEYVFDCAPSDAACFENRGEDVVEYRPGHAAQLDRIRSMHEQDGSLIVRQADEYAPLFQLPKMKTLLALRHNQPEAYLVVSAAANKPGLIEGGGSERALETLLHAALQSFGTEREGTVPAYSYRTSCALGRLLDRKLPHRRREMDQGPMMVRINRVTTFMENVRGWLEKKNAGLECAFSLRVTDTGERISFRMSGGRLTLGRETMDHHYELSARALVPVLFGPHPARPAEVPKLPESFFSLPLPVWMLDRS